MHGQKKIKLRHILSNPVDQQPKYPPTHPPRVVDFSMLFRVLHALLSILLIHLALMVKITRVVSLTFYYVKWCLSNELTVVTGVHDRSAC